MTKTFIINPAKNKVETVRVIKTFRTGVQAGRVRIERPDGSKVSVPAEWLY